MNEKAYYGWSNYETWAVNELLFQVLVRNDNTASKLVTLKAIRGPGDTPEPVLTILLPNED